MQSIFNVLALVLDSSELIMTQWWTLYKDNNHKEHHATTSLHDQQNCLVCIGALRKMMINLSVGNKNSSYVAYVFSAETNFKTIIVSCTCLYHSIICWKQRKAATLRMYFPAEQISKVIMMPVFYIYRIEWTKTKISKAIIVSCTCLYRWRWEKY